jgi:hypothetical protein
VDLPTFYALLFGVVYLAWWDFAMNLSKEQHQISWESREKRKTNKYHTFCVLFNNFVNIHITRRIGQDTEGSGHGLMKIFFPALPLGTEESWVAKSPPTFWPLRVHWLALHNSGQSATNRARSCDAECIQMFAEGLWTDLILATEYHTHMRQGRAIAPSLHLKWIQFYLEQEWCKESPMSYAGFEVLRAMPMKSFAVLL